MRDHCTIPMQVCEFCGSLFALTPRRLKTGQRHCSRRCAVITRNIAGRHPHAERPCLECGAVLNVRVKDIERGRGRFCDKTCMDRYHTIDAAERTCDYCGIRFMVSARGLKSGQRFCTFECAGHGKRPSRPAPPEQQAARFWSKVKRTEECWPWIGYRMKNGYGTLGSGNGDYDGKKVLAHRMAYELTHGPIPAGKVIRHTCDNPPCCRPEHLLVGTYLENMRDCSERGRSCAGERNGMAKLTANDVRTIRDSARDGWTYAELSRTHGVNRTTIRSIVEGRTWRHLL